VLALYKEDAYPAFNWAGMFAFLIPVSLTMVAITFDTLMWFYNYGWFTGAISGAVLYYVINQFSPKLYVNSELSNV